MVNIAIVVYYGGRWEGLDTYVDYNMDGVVVDDTSDFSSFRQSILDYTKLSIPIDLVCLYTNLEMSSGMSKLIPLLEDKDIEYFFAVHKSGTFKKCPIIIEQSRSSSLNIQPIASLDSATSVAITSSSKSLSISKMGSLEYIDFIDLNNIPENFTLRVCMAFPNKGEVKKAFQVASMLSNFQYRTLRSNSQFLIASCAKPDCTWYARASLYLGGDLWVIRDVNLEHSCDVDVSTKFHRQATSAFVSECIQSKISPLGDQEIKPSSISSYMKEKFHVDISYQTAWRSKELAMSAVMGDPAKSYSSLPIFAHDLCSSNPGSVTHISIDEDQRFKFFFFAVYASICGWKYCRPVISVDGTFLTNKFAGTLLTACTLDGNNQIFPLAFAIVDSENDAAWEWFFMNMKSTFGTREDLVIVSDRHNSIANGVSSIFPEAHHGLCMQHLLNNLKTRFRYHNFDCIYYECVKAYTPIAFEKYMSKMDNNMPGIRQYLYNVGFERWAQSCYPKRRYMMHTTNCSESLNNRFKKPRDTTVASLCENIRQILQDWFYERRLANESLTTKLTKFAEKFVAEQIELSLPMFVHPASKDKFQVFHNSTQYIVNLALGTCTCKMWDIEAIPCSHACAAIKKSCKSVHNYTSCFYSSEYLTNTYAETVHPLESSIDTQFIRNEILPPNVKRPAGRPKKKRIPSANESKTQFKCGRCGRFGHNKRTCRYGIP